MRAVVTAMILVGLAVGAAARDAVPDLNSADQQAETEMLLREVATRLERVENAVRPLDPDAPPVAAVKALGRGAGSDRWTVQIDLRSVAIGAIGTAVAVGGAVVGDKLGAFDEQKRGFAAFVREVRAWRWPWTSEPEPEPEPEPDPQRGGDSDNSDNSGTVIHVTVNGDGNTVNVDAKGAEGG